MSNNEQVPEEAKKGLLDIMNDSGVVAKIGKEEIKIRPLRVYSMRKIAEYAWHIHNTEAKKEAIFQEMASNIEFASHAVAVMCLNETFTENYEDNEKRIEEKAKWVELNTYDFADWTAIFTQCVLPPLNISGFFLFTACLPMLSDMVTRRKETTRELSQSRQELQ